VEVTYPPGTGSPHVHTNGVMAFVISGTIVSKVGDGPEQTFHAGDAWWGPRARSTAFRATQAPPHATLLAIYIAPKGAMLADLTKPLRQSK
jgi:quercetin dioxygenase-like cupin family protein